MVTVFTWIIFGALAGWVAALIGRRSMTPLFLWNALFGTVGAVLGGLIYVHRHHPLIFDSGNLSAALIGAVALLALANFIRQK